MTQQEVMKNFMHSLDETDKSGRSALDDAVKSSSNFKSYNELVEKFQSDWKNAGNWHTFLVKYCGIILDNKDTGSILGKDAGGETSKGADDIILCKGDAIYPEGTSFTVNGLTIYGIPPKESLTQDQQIIVQGLYSWWIRDALDLIEESYGLSYTEEKTTNSRMKLRLYAEEDGALAYVEPHSDYEKEIESRTLGVNMAYFKNMSLDNRQGKVEINGTDYYLVRTIVHELTHGVMASNINYMPGLPLPIIEGATAELIHGADDNRRNNIIKYAKNEDSSFEKLVKYLNPESAGVEMGVMPYAGGYIFMRYFLKQAADTNFDYDSYRENISVDDENFAVNYFDKVTMTGSNLADTITNSGGNVTINAQDGANLIRNYSDDVKITSGAGIDSIYNENSAVEINSGAGNDYIDNSGSDVTVDGGAGDDSISGGNSNFKINAGAGNDNIFLFGFDDSISGNTVYGGKGNDFINSNFATSIFYGDAGNDSIQSSGANSSVKGGAGVDSITNTGENAIIWSDAGNDLIINGSDSSSIGLSVTTTSDEDTDLSSIGANSTIFGGAGNDSIQNSAKESFIYGGAGKDSVENGGVSSFLFGNAGNDYFSNESNFVSIHGGAGKDIIENSGASSALYGDAGNDSITNEKVFATIYGGAGKDIIENGGASSALYGDAGNDKITNNASNVEISGGAGNDNVENRGDEVLIVGEAGKDSIYNSGAKVEIDLGAGNDYIYNEGAVISIKGGAGNDKIYNFGDHVTISGGKGRDSIRNEGKNVSISGGKGNDKLWGGKNADIFIYGKGDGKDIIYGFDDADILQITGTFSGSYNEKKGEIAFKIDSTKNAIKLKDFTATSFNINGETYKINGSSLSK